MAQQPAQPAEPAQPAQPSEPRSQQPQRSQQDSSEGEFVHIPTGPSEMIASVDYNPKTLDLIVQFVNGMTYHFQQVDQVAIANWSSAASPGRFFNANVKNAGFEYEQIS